MKKIPNSYKKSLGEETQDTQYSQDSDEMSSTRKNVKKSTNKRKKGLKIRRKCSKKSRKDFLNTSSNSNSSTSSRDLVIDENPSGMYRGLSLRNLKNFNFGTIDRSPSLYQLRRSRTVTEKKLVPNNFYETMI